MATGFGSLSAFSRAYRDHFGHTARDERNFYRTQRSLDFLPPINQSLVADCRSVGQAGPGPNSISQPYSNNQTSRFKHFALFGSAIEITP
jgi:hypothetical protein